MRKFIRVLSIVIRVNKSNLRYKIAYYRNDYPGYNYNEGDILDAMIYNFFQQESPSQIRWEFIGEDGLGEVGAIFHTFTSKIIPLIISASITDASDEEKQRLVDEKISFLNQNCQVTLFYRENLTQKDENWASLPASIHVSIDYIIYQRLARTILNY